MKKILVLLAVLATALVFTTGAFADACSICKCPLRNVDCPAGGQVAATCFEFDYDAGNTAFDGFCLTDTYNCKAILHVCDCLPDPNAFVAGLDVGVKMTILVNGVAGDRGAYFSNTLGSAPVTITVDTAATQAAACALLAPGTGVTSGNFGGHTYYLSDSITPVAPAALPSDPTCTVAAGSRATILESTIGGPGFIIPALSGEWWWIDIPPMRIDPALAASGATVQVKVELVDNTGLTICGGCTLCECIIDIAKVCCTSVAATTNLTFPYFAANASFWRGMAIINPGTTDGTATLTLHDADGDTATATVSVPAGGMFVDSVDSITWTGAADVDGRSYITAECNYGGAEGFAMMGDGSEAMGYVVD